LDYKRSRKKEKIIMAIRTESLGKQQVKPVVESQVSAADQAMGAAMIASGIGSLVLGIAIILAEVSPGFKTFVTWNSGVGPLSGKTGVSVIAFVFSWVVLHYALKGKSVSLTTSFIWTIALVVLGLLLTFPPVFMSFGG
jgi:hypothetical protein